MIFSTHPIQILNINNKAAEVDAIRFDKGSSSPNIFDIKLLNENKILQNQLEFVSKYPSEKIYPDLINIIKKIELEINNRSITDQEVCIVNGALSGIFAVLALLANEGDSVIINEISFEGFSSIIKTLNLNSISADYNDKKDLEQKIIDTHAKILILNTPENPSGKLYSEEFLMYLNELAEKYDMHIISDEINNQIIYPPFKYIPPSQYIKADKLISINSFSKNYFLSGIRLGWTIGNKNIIKKIHELISTSQVGVSYSLQVLASNLVSNCQTNINEYKKRLHIKKELMETILIKNHFTYLNPVMSGSVFFIQIKNNGEKLSEYVLNRYKIGVVPGVYFGEKWSNWLRIGFGAVTEDQIKKYVPYLKEADDSLKNS